ncbi:hypothetical protein WJX82_007495 [Trebouxia sp. C0006]
MPQHPLSSALPVCMPFSCESSASTAQGPCLSRQDSVSMAKATQQKRGQLTVAQHVSPQLISVRPGPATDHSNVYHMAKPGSKLPQGADPKHEYACSAVPQNRLLSWTGLQCDTDQYVRPELCCFAPCPPESNDSQTSQFDQHLALPDSMAPTASDTPSSSLPDPPEAPTDLAPGGCSDIDSGFSTAKKPLAAVRCVPIEDCFPASVAPITHPEQLFVSAGLSNHDMSSSLASTDIADSLYEHLDDATAKAHTTSAEGDLGSVVDCPGSSLVPNDWLTDEREDPDLPCLTGEGKEPNLPCLVSLVYLGKPVCTSLPLMPPSLRDCSTSHAAGRFL